MEKEGTTEVGRTRKEFTGFAAALFLAVTLIVSFALPAGAATTYHNRNVTTDGVWRWAFVSSESSHNPTACGVSQSEFAASFKYRATSAGVQVTAVSIGNYSDSGSLKSPRVNGDLTAFRSGSQLANKSWSDLIGFGGGTYSTATMGFNGQGVAQMTIQVQPATGNGQLCSNAAIVRFMK